MLHHFLNGEEDHTDSPDKTVINFILHGTLYHQSNSSTFLNTLAEMIKKGPTQFVHVINGVGGTPPPQAAKTEPMLGTYDFTCDFDPSTNEITTQKTARSSDLCSEI